MAKYFYGTGDNFGFTIAEVLITLGIIGIVTAVTLPSIINNNRNKQLEAQLKTAYSLIYQAVLLMGNEDPELWQTAQAINLSSGSSFFSHSGHGTDPRPRQTSHTIRPDPAYKTLPAPTSTMRARSDEFGKWHGNGLDSRGIGWLRELELPGRGRDAQTRRRERDIGERSFPPNGGTRFECVLEGNDVGETHFRLRQNS